MRDNGLFNLKEGWMDCFKRFILLGINSLLHKSHLFVFLSKGVPWEECIKSVNDFSRLCFLCHGQFISLCCSPLLCVCEYLFLLDLSIVVNCVGRRGDIKSSTHRWLQLDCESSLCLQLTNSSPDFFHQRRSSVWFLDFTVTNIFSFSPI